MQYTFLKALQLKLKAVPEGRVFGLNKFYACLSHGILQARILEWVAIPFSRGSSNSRIEPRTPAFQADSLLSEPPGKPTYFLILEKKNLYSAVFKDTLSISEKGPCMYKGDCKEAQQFEGD